VVAGTAITVALHLSVPFLTELPVVRYLALASAITSAAAIFYTVVFIAPTNKALGTLDLKDSFTEQESSDAMKLVGKWDMFHKGREVIYFGGWALGFAALLLAVAGP
jgi:hypothetical protein